MIVQSKWRGITYNSSKVSKGILSLLILFVISASLTVTSCQTTETRAEIPEIIKMVLNNDIEGLKACVERGDNINARSSNGETALSSAIISKKYDMAEYLLKKGADPDVKNNDGMSILYYSVVKDDIKSVKLLLDYKANPDSRFSKNNNASCLISAIMNNNYDIANLLISKGALVEKVKDDNGFSPLFYAAKFNTPEIAILLLRKGAQVNSRSNAGWTPLHGAAEKDSVETAKILIRNGANIDPEIPGNGSTPLIIAAAQKSNRMLDLLLRHGANPKHKAQNGVNAIMLLAFTGNEKGLEIMKKYVK